MTARGRVAQSGRTTAQGLALAATLWATVAAAAAPTAAAPPATATSGAPAAAATPAAAPTPAGVMSPAPAAATAVATPATPAAGRPAVSRPPRASAARSPAGDAATRGPNARALDRLELDATQITGNRELPKVMVVVPWKRSDIGDLVGKPANSLIDEALQPVDREVFRRQVDYYGVLGPDRPRDATAVTNGAQDATGAGAAVRTEK